MVEKFIERGTDYPLEQGMLSIYETNCACKDIQFYFDQYVLTLMLAGHKTITTEHLKFEFFPGTFFIPEKDTINNVSIPNATIDSPTKCLVLKLDPTYLQSLYEEIFHSAQHHTILHQHPPTEQRHFFSNDRLLIKAFVRLYQQQLKDRSPSKALIDDLIIRELIYRIFPTEGLHLLRRDFARSVEDDAIRRTVMYIQANIEQKLTTEQLARHAGFGQTTFFKKFKQATGYSPIDYILHERIRQAKILIQKDRMNLQSIAFQCGFNSYEYFCSSFKKIEKLKPTEYRRSKIRA